MLEHVLNTASDELERELTAMLNDFEQQLFRLSDHARSPALQAEHMQTLRTLQLNRSDLVPRFMMGLEANLAALGRIAATSPPASEAPCPVASRT